LRMREEIMGPSSVPQKSDDCSSSDERNGTEGRGR